VCGYEIGMWLFHRSRITNSVGSCTNFVVAGGCRGDACAGTPAWRHGDNSLAGKRLAAIAGSIRGKWYGGCV
jgi:hypothetical protein